MTTVEIKEKLHHYIDTAENKKLKAIYTMVEDDIADKYDVWQDEEFVNELLQREKDLQEGKTKGYTIEEAVANAKTAIANLK